MEFTEHCRNDSLGNSKSKVMTETEFSFSELGTLLEFTNEGNFTIIADGIIN